MAFVKKCISTVTQCVKCLLRPGTIYEDNVWVCSDCAEKAKKNSI